MKYISESEMSMKFLKLNKEMKRVVFYSVKLISFMHITFAIVIVFYK